ncbi:uncharacterized protein BO97DRAFT_472140 [Aspergillus homomorphus CBS 101889]|uniref:Uncharacterized protein n=1 Tax=Aspergillus homomorphus (strain CBS 101889) TaxID=1450537 RepID=A0A395HPT6_ASPHC|nr:hypothetical protein BO97DRAFT_472140 [Aspergillus homomorphus CBS 101889]RAL09837.1 hypothetical protein BO97DRAFT_472140 [Aspergillus homomorphus CBS 101889]
MDLIVEFPKAEPTTNLSIPPRPPHNHDLVPSHGAYPHNESTMPPTTEPQPKNETKHYNPYPPKPTKPTTQTQKPTRKRHHQEGKPPTNRCWDWLLLPATSNTHFAKNRASFETYRRAPCKIANQRVLGVGTVQLRVRRAPNDARTTTLVLHDVLHMPDARCNGVSVAKYTGDLSAEYGVGGRRGSEEPAEGEEPGQRHAHAEGHGEDDTTILEGAEVVVGVEGEGDAEHLQVRRASTSTISSVGSAETETCPGEGLWFADRRPETGCSRVVLAGEHQMLDIGDLENEKMLRGLVISKEELEVLNERIRNRSWV